jgi:hypothetical protein
MRVRVLALQLREDPIDIKDLIDLWLRLSAFHEFGELIINAYTELSFDVRVVEDPEVDPLPLHTTSKIPLKKVSLFSHKVAKLRLLGTLGHF